MEISEMDDKIKKANKTKVTKVQDKEERGITIPLEKLPGAYCNTAFVHHTKNEFALDFILDIAGQANFVSRVITSPDHIKRLNNALTENIKKYEDKFGKIKIED
jgi:hypothetical protein